MSERAVMVYGSVARGASNEVSDLDLLVVGDEVSQFDGLGLLHGSPLMDRPHAYVAQVHYTWPQMEAMASRGSLFLHHLRDEGVFLGESLANDRLSTLLDALPHHRGTHKELRSFSRALEDAMDSLVDTRSPAFEATVVATTTRHASILGTYILGEVRFAARESIQNVLRATDMDWFTPTALELYSWRVAHVRAGIPLPASWTRARIHEFAESASAMVSALERIAEGTR